MTMRERVDVAARVARLQDEYLNDTSHAVASLARLRRGVAAPPGADLELIGLTTANLYPEDERLPDEPTDAEHAVYTAICLFALHQQSHRSERMHRPGFGFGRSARILATRSGTEDAVRRRFTALGTATTWEEAVHHARGLVQQFRAFDVPLDYGRFARDLLGLRSPRGAARVRNAWGRDFYRTSEARDESTAPDAETSTADND